MRQSLSVPLFFSMISWAILVNALSISVLFMSSLDMVVIPYIDIPCFVILACPESFRMILSSASRLGRPDKRE
jgi:hypothetical protein